MGNALQEGVTPEDVVGVLFALARQVRWPPAVAAAAQTMLTPGLSPPPEA